MTVLREKLLPTLDYLLHEWLDIGALLRRPRFADHDLASIDAVLRTAADLAAKWFEPANRVIDDHEPQFEDGRVVLPKVTQEAWDAHVEFGFMLASHDAEHGGLQLPRTVDFATKVILGSASVGISPGMLTEANAALLLAHGNSAQRQVFAQRELAGVHFRNANPEPEADVVLGGRGAALRSKRGSDQVRDLHFVRGTFPQRPGVL